MKQGLVLFVAVMAAGNSMAQGEPRQADPPLVVNGNLSLTTLDFDAYLQKVPANLRDEFRRSPERINPTVDSLWIQRVLSEKARAKGLDKDPILAARMRQAVETVLADAYVQKVIDAGAKIPDLEVRAREIYKANPKDYLVPEHISVQHILVTLRGRTHDMAAERARQVYAEAKSADKPTFEALAKKYSEDATLAKNDGELKMMATTSYEEPIPAKLAKLRIGEVTEPIETRHGFHIMRLTERRAPRVVPFEDVKDKIIAAEKDKIFAEVRLAAVAEVRGDPGNHVYLENVQALKSTINIPLDAESLSKLKSRER
jgi:peptidyl-prolyl cis-trans isomerase C